MLRNHDVQETTVSPLSVFKNYESRLLFFLIGSVSFDLWFVLLIVIILLPKLNTAGLHDNVIKLADNYGSTKVNNKAHGAVLSNVCAYNNCKDNELVEENKD